LLKLGARGKKAKGIRKGNSGRKKQKSYVVGSRVKSTVIVPG